jgi:hypothetical protein
MTDFSKGRIQETGSMAKAQENTDAPLRNTKSICVQISDENQLNQLECFGDRVAGMIYLQHPWRQLLDEVFGHQPLFAVATVDDRIVNILPMYRVRHPVMGVKLVSLPYDASHGGCIFDDPDSETAILKNIEKIESHTGAKSIEIRTTKQQKELQQYGFREQKPFLTSHVKLTDIESNWSALSPKHRRNVRAAKKRDVIVRYAENLDEIRTFYQIVSDHFHSIGVPFPDVRYFIGIWEILVPNDQAKLIIAEYNNQIIGGHLLLINGNQLVSKYSACIRNKDTKKLYASYALFWKSIEIGIERNLISIDLGITGVENTGLLDFKNRFGAITKPVYFFHRSAKDRAPNYSKYYEKYRIAKALWRVAPSILTTTIGHQINRWVC